MTAAAGGDRARSRARLRRIATRVETWFDSSARDLPWRRKRTAYRALVSEIMLQQTQVDRVAGRLESFIKRFPTVCDLARAGESDVLHEWQGLGYYRRAKHLHEAARVIVRRHGGRVPRRTAELRALPGVGRYTAGAIASIVFGEREPVVDGNVQRVLARLFARRSAPDAADERRWVWETARALVECCDDSGALNEGLMELGATLCTRAAPDCEQCPLRRLCAARRMGSERDIPRAKRRAPQKRVHHHALIIRRGGRILIEQRPAFGLWAGMWQVPTIESDRRLSTGELSRRAPVAVRGLRTSAAFEHRTTHRRIDFHIFEGRSSEQQGVWRRPADLADLPLSNPQRRILAAL